MSSEACEMVGFYLRKIPQEKSKCTNIQTLLELCDLKKNPECVLIKKDLDYCNTNVKRMEDALSECNTKCKLYNQLSGNKN
ncbi:putative ORFan [Tupanvirus deep ocean]|uniref:ORFan n=2 Tax=Tupanvirus TaxID=2094720 RepID=A0AC62A7P1_9VIRU|nr:putative ORFan [Tupanvirus deep ocean]QKU33744.1 putative ORFan [Tupanvirus deep ocean]